jgi:hypothetical protein
MSSCQFAKGTVGEAGHANDCVHALLGDAQYLLGNVKSTVLASKALYTGQRSK